jgi:hypothetical protein
MGSIWNLAGVEELDFAATATLLAISARQQSIARNALSGTRLDDAGEDYSDEEVEDDASDSPRQIAECSQARLTDKFLNRLAEVLAREKSPYHNRNQQDSRHIAAVLCLGPTQASPFTVLIAKNGGLDDTDQRLLARLQVWLRAVSHAQRPPPTQADRLWVGDNGLLEYSRGRLWYHITQINQSSGAIAALEAHAGVHGPLVNQLQCFCGNAKHDSSIQYLNDIVDKAYELRCVWNELDPVKHQRALRHIGMLGRLRAAYLCFQTVACKLPGVSAIELISLEHQQSRDIKAKVFRKQLKRVGEELQLPASLMTAKGVRKYTGSWYPHIHAEMQLLVNLARKPEQQERIHRYIGLSKKPCFVCRQVLLSYYIPSQRGTRKPFFNVRQTHGKVYPLWTLPYTEFVPSGFSLAVAAATKSVYESMLELLQKGTVRQPAIAESSAGITESTAPSRKPTVLQKRYLADQHALNSTKEAGENDDKIVLGPKVKSVAVGLLPVDGSHAMVANVAFHALPVPSDPRIPEFGHDLVPDFHDAWGECQFNRGYRDVELRAQESDELNGDYRLYWNESPDLSENRSVKAYICEDTVEAARRLWYGDVFVVRFTENPETFAYNVYDVPQDITRCQAWKNLFQQMWADQFLERQLEDGRHFAEEQAKRNSDKDIILSRM